MDTQTARTDWVGKVAGQHRLTDKAGEVVIDVENGFDFKEGQYIWLILPQLAYPDPAGQRRAFSITSPSANPRQITIIYRDSQSGYKQTLRGMSKGDLVQISGPFGSSYIPETDKKTVFIAGGVGIAPFLSILRSSTLRNAIHPKLVYLNSGVDKAVHSQELTKLANSGEIGYTAKTGMFTPNMLPGDTNYKSDNFFVCGPPKMVDAVYLALSQKGVEMAQIHFEQHYPAPPGNLQEGDFWKDRGSTMYKAVQDSRHHVVITDANGLVIFANKAAETTTGFTFEEMRGNTPRLWGGLMSADFYKRFWHSVLTSGGFDGELFNRRKNGEVYQVKAHVSPLTNDDGTIVGFIGTEEDISVLKSAEHKLLEKSAELEQAKVQLEAKLKEADKLNNLMIGRELKMVELKKKITELGGKIE